MAEKMSFFANEAIFSCKVASLIDFDLLKTKICVINTFGEQLPFKKRLKSKNSKWPPQPEMLQKLKRIAPMIVFDLLNMKMFQKREVDVKISI